MKLTEKRIKEIILEEVQVFLEQPEIVKKLQNVGQMSIETFKKFIDTLTQEISLAPVTAMDNYLELALELKETSWSLKYWESFSEDERKLFLGTTYPGTPYHESTTMMDQSFTNPNIAQLIYQDTLLAVEKANELKKGTQAGEYLGPKEPGGEPESPYWKEFLEEAIEEEINELIKNDA
tara:strand:- start:2290 stop:2826 length:537 start_codon:yes stop_codon:yes gene_type:complete